MEKIGRFVKLWSNDAIFSRKLITGEMYFYFRPRSKDDLNRVIPKHITKFQLFVSDDILLYSLVYTYIAFAMGKTFSSFLVCTQ